MVDLDRLMACIRPVGKLAVACSGGVDSTLLTRVACDAVGVDNVVALHAHGPMHTREELDNVKSLIKEIGCRLHLFDYNPLRLDGFRKNPVDRCYHCKKEIYGLFRRWASSNDLTVLADGTNIDDLGDDRPGLKALEEFGILLPFVKTGLRKEEIRKISKKLGLSNWNRLSASCLATRISCGTEITVELLEQVARCEDFLDNLGFAGCRVRLIEKHSVHIEIQEADFPKFADISNRKTISEFFSALGMNKVFIDITGR